MALALTRKVVGRASALSTSHSRPRAYEVRFLVVTRSAVEEGSATSLQQQRDQQRAGQVPKDVEKQKWPVHSSQTLRVLDTAQAELEELCAATKDPDCWKAHSYFMAKRNEVELHCDVEHEFGEHNASACDTLSRFAKLTLEHMSAGGAHNLRNNLLIMQRAEERRAAHPEANTPPPTPEMSPSELHKRVELITLFHQLDANGDGMLSTMEFDTGLERAGAVLDEDDLRMISDALGARAQLDIDDFIGIVESSRAMMSGLNSDATFLRHAAHMHGHHAHPKLGGAVA